MSPIMSLDLQIIKCEITKFLRMSIHFGHFHQTERICIRGSLLITATLSYKAFRKEKVCLLSFL